MGLDPMNMATAIGTPVFWTSSSIGRISFSWVRAAQLGRTFIFAEAISHWYGGGPPPSEIVDPHADHLSEIGDAADRMVAYLHEAKVPVTPSTTAAFHVDHGYGNSLDAIEYAERLADAGADEIMCIIQMGTIPQSVCLETIRQWGEHVIPHFRAKGH